MYAATLPTTYHYWIVSSCTAGTVTESLGSYKFSRVPRNKAEQAEDFYLSRISSYPSDVTLAALHSKPLPQQREGARAKVFCRSGVRSSARRLSWRTRRKLYPKVR